MAADDRETAPATAMTGPGPPLQRVPRTRDSSRRRDLTSRQRSVQRAPAASIEAPLRRRTLATHLAPEAAPGAAVHSAAPAAAPVTVRVLVRDLQGTVIPGARVIATSFTREGEARPPQWVDSSLGSLERVPLTNAEGWSTLVVPAMERLRLTVLTPGEGKVLHTRDVQALRKGESREVVLGSPAAKQPQGSGAATSGVPASALPGTWSVQARSSEGRALRDLRWTSSPSPRSGAREPARTRGLQERRTLLPGLEPHVALIETDGFAPRPVVPARTEPQRAQRLEPAPSARRAHPRPRTSDRRGPPPHRGATPYDDRRTGLPGEGVCHLLECPQFGGGLAVPGVPPHGDPAAPRWSPARVPTGCRDARRR